MLNLSLDRSKHTESAPGDDLAALQADLRASLHTPLRQVHCQVSDHRIILLGTVPSFYHKQMAQSVALSRLGSKYRLYNQLKVVIADKAAPARNDFTAPQCASHVLVTLALPERRIA